MNDDRLAISRTVAIVAAVFVVSTCAIGLIAQGTSTVFGLLSGPLSAVYCGTLLWQRRDYRAEICVALALVAGFAHVFWVMSITRATVPVWQSLGIRNELTVMLSITALVFSAIIGVGTRSVLAAVIVLGGGLLACVLDRFGSMFALSSDGSFNLAIGTLHLGNLAALALANERDLRPPPKGVCAHCGYDLRGLAAAVCPECGRRLGQPRSGP